MNTNLHQTSTFVDKYGNTIFEQNWLPQTTPVATVIIVHGLGEHSSRYTHVAKHLNEHGFAVYSYDHVGHGRSGGRPGFIENFDVLRDDLDQFIKRVRKQAPDRKLFVLGHSMGGLVTAYTTVTLMPDMDGVIFSASALNRPDDVPAPLMAVSGFLSRYAPKLKTVKLEFEGISRDEGTMKQYMSDPLIYRGGIPARTATELFRAMDVVSAGMDTIRYPMLIFHGTEDVIVNVEDSMQLYARAASADKTLKLFDGFYHECMNEPEREEVLTLISDWLNARLDSADSTKQSHHKARAAKKKAAAS